MRHQNLVRLHNLIELLGSRDGHTLEELGERLGTCERTVQRSLQALEQAGYTLEISFRDRAKVYSLAKMTRALQPIGVSTQTVVVLFLLREAFGFLRGTGFAEDLDDFYARLQRMLNHKDFLLAKSLDRRLYNHDEMPHIYEGRSEQMDVLVNALVKNERVMLTHETIYEGKVSVPFELYTLMIYKKGLYLIGRTPNDGKIVRLALDEVVEVERVRGDRFEYPKKYAPRDYIGQPFGIRRGKREKVVLRFAPLVKKYIKRRLLHPTQKVIEEADGSVTLEMTPEGFDQLDSFVLGYRDNVEVVEPGWFREDIKRQLVKMGAIYGLKLVDNQPE